MRVTLRGNTRGKMAKASSVGKMLLFQARVGAEEMGEKWVHCICILELESLGFTEGRVEVPFEGS